MKKINLLSLIHQFFHFFSTSATSNDKIIGGIVIDDLNHPAFKYTVRLLITQRFSEVDAPELNGRKYTNKCSGVVISEEKILTAAHCFPTAINLNFRDGVRRVRLVDRSISIYSWYKAGSPEISGIPAKDYIVHPDYDEEWVTNFPDVWNPQKRVNDIAIVKYQAPLRYGKEPISLSKVSPLNFKDKNFRLSGFGKSSRSQIEISSLKYVDIPFNRILQNEVDFALGSGNYPSPSEVKNPKGGCFGDSGGPIVVDNQLVGIISRGPGKENGGCFSSISIGTSVYTYLDWIGL